jgi:hypothetical protein
VPNNTYYGTSDTIAVRLRNISVAVSEVLAESPVIGLGTASFGQRYLEPGCNCPSNIPNVTAATLYESGVVGLVAISVAFGLLLAGVLRADRLELVAALVVLLIGYQFTDALRFASSWMVAGIALSASAWAPRISAARFRTREWFAPR